MRSKGMLAAVLCGALAMPASAWSMRYPSDGAPAFVYELPAGWSSRLDEAGNMIIASADRDSAFTLDVSTFGDTARISLDDFAAQILRMAKAEPFTHKEAHALSGFQGYAYDTTMTNGRTAVLNVRLILLTLDASHIVSCVMMTKVGDTPAQRAQAQAFVEGLALTPAPGVPR